jgi:hypothetical protein
MNTEQTITVQTKKPTGLIIVSWCLLILTCLISMIPGVGFIAWLIGAPVLLVSLVCGIVAISKGASLQGVLILLFTLIIAPIIMFVAPIITTTGVVAVGVAEANEQMQQATQEKINALAGAVPSSISYDDKELAEMFSFGSKYTDLQRGNKSKELVGEIIEWEMTVYDVKKRSGYYYININDGLSSNNINVSNVDLYPQTEEEVEMVESLTEGTKIKVKGYIKDTILRNFTISPAILTN